MSELSEFLDNIYKEKNPVAAIDNVDDFLSRILGEVLPLFGEYSKRLPVETMAVALITGREPDIAAGTEIEVELEPGTRKKYQQTLGAMGLYVTREGDLAIARRHHAIAKLIGKALDYHKLLERHPKCKCKDKVVSQKVGKPCHAMLFDIMSDPKEEAREEINRLKGITGDGPWEG